MTKFNAQIIRDAGYSVSWELPPGVEASEETIENILDELINEWGFPETQFETYQAFNHIIDVGILEGDAEKTVKDVIKNIRINTSISLFDGEDCLPKFKSIHQQNIVDFVERETNE